MMTPGYVNRVCRELERISLKLERDRSDRKFLTASDVRAIYSKHKRPSIPIEILVSLSAMLDITAYLKNSDHTYTNWLSNKNYATAVTSVLSILALFSLCGVIHNLLILRLDKVCRKAMEGQIDVFVFPPKNFAIVLENSSMSFREEVLLKKMVHLQIFKTALHVKGEALKRYMLKLAAEDRHLLPLIATKNYLPHCNDRQCAELAKNMKAE